ncbi:hypothetical protein HAX54_003619 [Datura stramonium]|uniref:Uncharacterized protein n=1 Tax=Datura stramonium TaxID=4076 RepID=A0ABS8WW81_DATST|nr:hypothetical protein [Datura stramonium]
MLTPSSMRIPLSGVLRDVRDCMLGVMRPSNPLRMKGTPGRGGRIGRQIGRMTVIALLVMGLVPPSLLDPSSGADLIALQELLGGLPRAPQEGVLSSVTAVDSEGL